MNIHSGHLKEEQLLDCYVATSTGERLDPRAADHMSACVECVTRYDDLVSFMGGLRQEAEAEVDELFPAERLQLQQEQILQRLEHVTRSARVITFPARAAASVSSSVVRLTPRWVAAAAAAGLFIGVGVGGYFGPDRLHRRPTAPQSQTAQVMTVQQHSTASTPVLVSSTPQEAPDDDAFLVELEMALDRPHTRELLPFDAMTPHIRDIDSRVR